MLSESDSIWAEAGETILKISADEHMRQLLEAREDYHRRQIDAQTLYNKAIKERDDAEMERAKAEKERDNATAKLDAALARIAELEKQLADKS